YAIYDQNGAAIGPATSNETADTDPYEFEIPYNLDSGLYFVEVTALDSPYCLATSNTVTITQPDPIEVELISNLNANCDINTATVTVNASGGTAPYNYAAVPSGNSAPLINDYVKSNQFNLNPDISSLWDVYVLDANGCTII